MPTVAVVMFCGPHDEGDRTPTRRIDHAINLARQFDAPLFIAGDAFGGAEVAGFQVRAWQAGVSQVLSAFDSRHCTLADAQSVAAKIVEYRLDRLVRLHLVTDWWHMERAKAMLEGECERMVGRRIHVTPSPVLTGPTPSPLVRQNEHQGLVDYLDGIYGSRKVVDPLWHRPELTFS